MKKNIPIIVATVAFIIWVLIAGHAFGFSTSVTATVKTHADKLVVYVLYGEGNQGYKEKKVNVDDSPEKVTIKIKNIDKGAPAKVCAYDYYDDDGTFKCSKYITLDQKKENVRIDIR
jgi:hypothetical protein